MGPDRVLILGAAGRDFHNFNVYFRDIPAYEVVAFTATQIPNIEDRTYPDELGGEAYPSGTPIDLGQLLDLDKPYQNVRYDLEEIGQPRLPEILEARFGRGPGDA